MITLEDNSFTSSINIKFDLGKKEFIDRYLPTPSHAESLYGLLKGFNSEVESHSHIIIGAYGTGKSLLGTLIGGIVSKNIDSKTLSVLSKKFKNVDDNIYNELQKVKENNKKYIPVVLNGHEGTFRQAIISAIIRALQKNGINITVPGMITNILGTVETWRRDFPETFKNFNFKLQQSNKEFDVWKSNILAHSNKEIEWFKDIFPSLTSGAQFVIDYNEDFVGQIIHVLDELNKKNIGLFIIYDEFGRFLQSMGSNEIYRTMQDLQDIAELSNHYSGMFQQLFITHKNLRHYFTRHNEEYQSEFQRIEKRFKLYHIDSDRNTFVRLTESLLSKQNMNYRSLDYEHTVTMIRKYPLFPDLNQVEIEELVIKGAYPIHPVTVYLLPHLSNMFAQNERTLFTFLESNEEGGLKHHLENSKRYYLPYKLFDYFFSDSHHEDFNKDSIKIMEVYNRLIRKVPMLATNNPDSIPRNIVKFITLWSLSGLNSQFKLTSDFLSFAFGMGLLELEVILDEMSKVKIIRFNRRLGYWELYEGSSLNLDEVIENDVENSTDSRTAKLRILEKNLNNKFYLPNNYNDEKSMTRFASVNFVFSGEIIDNSFDSDETRKRKGADALINYVLLEDPLQYEDVIKRVQNWEDSNSLFCISTKSLENINWYLLAHKEINNRLNDIEFLSQDPLLKEELLTKLEDIEYEIQKFIEVFTKFDESLTWYHSTRVYKINNSIVLERYLSDLMYNIYPKTPEIKNDSFNRRKINNVQLTAGQKVISHLIEYPFDDVIGIDGKGPEYLVFATVFKNNGVNIQNLDSIKSKNLSNLRNELVTYINKNTTGTLKELVDILSESPYGIRKPLIPVLLVGLLRDKWDSLMFYRNKIYVSGIDGKTFYKMVDEASEYEFKFYNFSDMYLDFFIALEDIFGEHAHEKSINKPKPIMLSSAMLGWLRNLPRFTQTTTLIDKELQDLRDNIRKSEIDPQNFIEELGKYYTNNIDLLRKQKRYLEAFLGEFKESLRKQVLSVLEKSSFSDLKRWAQTVKAPQQKSNQLIKSILNANADNWIDDLATTIVGVPIEDWTDTTNNMFKKHILDYYKLLSTDTSQDYITFSINGNDKAVLKADLSTKSKTIYNNVYRMINNAGRNVSKDEIEYLVLSLVEEFVE
ncbi:hypothetical protein [Oceanobacillus halotolerans]|uniref:hypothetical protein n=1 Tax=Oceanobacillus halotolerans TaxID=2663380 RepID=UPI0013DA6BD3|nr:hypothetical protein [Oceanobacillus halotolerans]